MVEAEDIRLYIKDTKSKNLTLDQPLSIATVALALKDFCPVVSHPDPRRTPSRSSSCSTITPEQQM